MIALCGRYLFGVASALSLLLVCILNPSTAWGRSLDEIHASGGIKVGVDVPYGVMEFFDANGMPAGIDIDLSREIAAEIGVEARFEIMPFDKLFDALKEGRVDLVVSAVTITPERQKTLLFSVPYLSANTVLAVSKSNHAIQSIDDLDGARLGVLGGTLGEELARKSKKLKGLTIIPYKNNDRRIEDLSSGKIDAAVVHFLVNTGLPIRIIGQPLRQNFYGVVAAPGNQELMDRVNKKLRAIKRDGTLEAIKKRYVN